MFVQCCICTYLQCLTVSGTRRLRNDDDADACLSNYQQKRFSSDGAGGLSRSLSARFVLARAARASKYNQCADLGAELRKYYKPTGIVCRSLSLEVLLNVFGRVRRKEMGGCLEHVVFLLCMVKD